MRVLFITSAYPARAEDPRGSFIHELARALVREGVKVTVVAPGAPGSPATEERDGVEVCRARYWVDRWQSLASGLGGILPNLRDKPWLVFQLPPLVLALVWRAMRLGGSADVIHAHWVYPSGIAGLAAARWHRKPFVVTSHGSDLNLAARVALLGRISAFVARRADACLGISRAMVGRFVRLGVRTTRLHHIPLGVESSRPPADERPRRTAATDWFAAFPGLKVIYAGRLIPLKSVHTLLEAQQLATARGGNVACLILGAGPCEPDLRRLADELPAGRVVFAGEQPPEQVDSFLRLADVLVLPSRSEGLGLVLVQAMMLGVAVIASDIEGPRELIEDGVTGMLFPAGESGALADRLATLEANPGMTRLLGARAREAVMAQGRTPAASAAAHAKVYRALLDQRAHRR